MQLHKDDELTAQLEGWPATEVDGAASFYTKDVQSLAGLLQSAEFTKSFLPDTQNIADTLREDTVNVLGYDELLIDKTTSADNLQELIHLV